MRYNCYILKGHVRAPCLRAAPLTWVSTYREGPLNLAEGKAERRKRKKKALYLSPIMIS